MGYHPPTLEELQKLPQALEATYINGNPARKKLIAFSKMLAEDPALLKSPHAVDILVGCHVFLMEMIYATYSVSDPRGGLFNSGSSLYQMMMAKLGIAHNNKMTQQQVLVYLAKFYEHVKNQLPELLPPDCPWVSKADLHQQFVSTAKSVIARQNQEVGMMLAAQPTVSQLKHNLRNVAERYRAHSKEQDKKRYFSSGMKHLPLAQLIDLVNDYSQQYLADVNEKEDGPGSELQSSHLVRFAIALYVMSVIEAEYKGYYLTCAPSNSLLYKICSGEEGINAADTRKIPAKDRLVHVTFLSHMLEHMLGKGKAFIEEKEKAGFKGLKKLLDASLVHCSEMRTECFKEMNVTSRMEGAMEYATIGVTQYGINALVRNVAGAVVPKPLSAAINVTTGAAIGTALAAIGIGPAGALFLGATISSTISNHVLPAALSGLIAGGMETIGTGVGRAVTKVVILPVRLTADVLYALAELRSSKPTDIDTLRQDKEWIAALLSLPPEVFSDADKHVLESTTGVKPMTV